MFLSQTAYTFDWARAIERNSEALRGIVATLFAMLGGDTLVTRLPEPLYRAVLRILHPAESALRRLIVIAARGLVVKPATSQAMPKGSIGKGQKRSRPAFKLFDPRKTFTPYGTAGPQILPRIHIFSYDPRVAAIFAARARCCSAPQQNDGLMNAQRLVNRVQALKSALDNLPHQARRLVRARARRENSPSLKFKSPLRPGPPPGHRKVKVHEIDEILTECHGLARDALRVDTS
jgi:hypothetical protein